MAAQVSSDVTLEYRLRANIVRYLETASSVETQIAYERGLTEAGAPGSVPVEMIEQWTDLVRCEDIGYQTVDIEMYGAPAFSADEQTAILRFHRVWNDVADSTPNPMPESIAELIGTPAWQRLIDAASEALEIFNVRGPLLDEAGFDVN